MNNKIILFLALAILTGGGVFYYYQEIVPCRNPIEYDIGGFDGRFGISKEKFITTAKEAEAVWETGGHDLFNYKPGAKFKINLVFDERQEQTIEAGQSKEEIEVTRAEYDSLLASYKSLAASYERDIAAYDRDVNVFEAKLDDYNRRVAEINKRGGAAPNEYKELERERESLEAEKRILDRERITLNGRASELNLLGDRVNNIARRLNIDVDLHNERFGEAREFDQGDYRGDRINIYQFNGTGDLRLVMAHEFGHALGIDHIENPESIMYYLMDEQNIQNPSLTREDTAALNRACNFK